MALPRPAAFINGRSAPRNFSSYRFSSFFIVCHIPFRAIMSPMRLTSTLLLLASLALLALPSDEDAVIATLQKTFDGMAAHDAVMIRSTMLPDARLYSVRDAASPTSTAAEDFIARVASMQGALLERFTARPQVSIRGRIAQLWGEYEFLHDNKFTHCGIDTATLFKTPDGWKIASLVYTAETTGCKGR
jgi:hypothetical protein